MIRRSFLVIMSAAMACVLAQGTRVQANSVNGTIALADNNVPTATGGNILTATVFSIGDSGTPILTTGASTGDFTAVAAGQAVGFTSFNATVGNSFVLGLPTGPLGEFMSSSISETVGNKSVTFNMTGTFTPGTDLASFTAGPASFTLTFNQNGGPGTAISDSMTLSSVPEPASIALLGIGMVGLFACRRLAKKNADA